MRVLVTGAAGFVGRRLVAALALSHDVVAVDSHVPDGAYSAVAWHPGDIRDRSLIAAAIGPGVDAVVHLATVPGGAAEQDPATAFSVNVEATVNLVAHACRTGRPRIVFASSIAIFGDDLPASIDDLSRPRPTLVYGVHKLMVEEWLATMSRRGACDALSLRVPGVVARPNGPSGMKSSFLSAVFHALRRGEKFVSPVSPAATMWMMSASKTVENLGQALVSKAPVGEPYAVTLPAIRTSMQALVAEIAHQTGSDPALVRYDADPLLEAGFGRQPPLSAAAALSLGFTADDSLPLLVSRVLDQLE